MTVSGRVALVTGGNTGIGAAVVRAFVGEGADVVIDYVKDEGASDALVRQYVFAGTIRDWQVIIPDFGTVEGPFQIASFELTGRHDGEVSFDLSLDSAGELTFAAA